MWRKVWQVTCFLTPAFSAQLAHDAAQPVARSILPPRSCEEEEARRAPRARRAWDGAFSEVRLDRLGRGARQRDVSVLAALAEDNAQDPLLGVDVVGSEVAELARRGSPCA